jgi:A nuclease family of the HNH/ENDO VII superfamily with conserved AHH
MARLYNDSRFDITVYSVARSKQFVDRRPDYFKLAFAKKGKSIGTTAEHHIIPVSLIDSVDGVSYDDMLKTLTTEGLFSIVDGRLNLVYLPTIASKIGQPAVDAKRRADADAAVKLTGMAKHTGNHNDYIDAVKAALEIVATGIFVTNHEEAAAVIGGIQSFLEANLLPSFVKTPANDKEI